MSQGSLIDDVTSWSKETCKQRLDEALPRLIADYCNGATSSRKVAILKTMVVSLQPLVEKSQRENEFLALVMPQTRCLFGDICSTILSALQEDGVLDLPQILHQNLKLLVEIINSLESSIQQVMPPRGETVAMETIESLPSNVLAVIQRSFSHCKESHTMYGDHFSDVSEPLSVLFKRAYSLQKALMALLEVVASSSGGTAETLSRVCTSFHELCGIISGMDTTLLVSTWRFLVKLTSKHKESILNSFQASPLVDSLCGEVESHFRHALQQAPHPPPLEGGGGSQGGDEKAFARTLKVCSLCFKMLHHLAKEFAGECLEECGPKVAEILLMLQSLAPPSLEATPLTASALDELQRSILVGIEPLIQLFMPSRRFCEALLSSNTEHPSNQSLALLMTLLAVLRQLPLTTEDARSLWLDPRVFPEDEPRRDLVSGIFLATKKCYVELNVPVCLPGVVCSGKPQGNVSLYEHIVTQLCGFIAALPSKYFHIVETCLLKNLLSNDWGCVILAIDVWCFMARYGSASLCAQQVHLLFDLVTSLPTNQSPAFIHICLLLRRLIPLMAAEHQVELVTTYPVEQNPDLWSLLPLTSLPDSTRNTVCERLITKCTAAIKDWEESSEPQHTACAVNLISSLHCVHRVLTQMSVNQPITDELTQPLATGLASLCSQLSLDKVSASMFAGLLNVASHLLHHIDPALIFELLKTAISLLEVASALELRLSSINFLRRLAKKALRQCPEQYSILDQIPVLFGKVLSDENILIHQQALEAFGSFAEETSHESVVPECIREEQVQSRVVNFLNQIPANEEITCGRSEVKLLQRQKQRFDATVNDLSTQQTLARTQPVSTSSKQVQDGSELESTIRTQTLVGSKLALTGEGEKVADGSRPDATSTGQTSSLVQPASTSEGEPQSKKLRSGSPEDEFRDAMDKLKEALMTLRRLQNSSASAPEWLEIELGEAKPTLDSLLNASR